VIRGRVVLLDEVMLDDVVGGVSSARCKSDVGLLDRGVTLSSPLYCLLITGGDGKAFDMCLQFLCRRVPASVSIWNDQGRAAGVTMVAVLH